jgi:hypothetical protein
MKRTILIHIPKAAGTSLRAILASQHPEGRSFLVGENAPWRREDFKGLPEGRRRRFTLLAGHIPFWFHDYFPDAVYVTMLRRPVDRVVSHYYYVLKTPEHYLYHLAREIGLAEYVGSGISGELDNGQVRQLADCEGVPFGQCDRDMLERAKANLARHFAVVGVAERFDESVVLMRRALGWESVPSYAKLNVNKSKPSVRSIPQGVIRLIEAHNQLDAELYEWVASRLAQAVAQGRPPVWLEVARSRLRNALGASLCRAPGIR